MHDSLYWNTSFTMVVWKWTHNTQRYAGSFSVDNFGFSKYAYMIIWKWWFFKILPFPIIVSLILSFSGCTTSARTSRICWIIMVTESLLTLSLRMPLKFHHLVWCLLFVSAVFFFICVCVMGETFNNWTLITLYVRLRKCNCLRKNIGSGRWRGKVVTSTVLIVNKLMSKSKLCSHSEENNEIITYTYKLNKILWRKGILLIY